MGLPTNESWFGLRKAGAEERFFSGQQVDAL